MNSLAWGTMVAGAALPIKSLLEKRIYVVKKYPKETWLDNKNITSKTSFTKDQRCFELVLIWFGWQT